MKMSGYEKIISAYGKARILVVGDLILDEYIQGKVDRISPGGSGAGGLGGETQLCAGRSG